MDGDGEDHLSALSDDLLRRILHLVPFKEAASTSVLSRRWGSLWCSSGAVNLAVRVNSCHQSSQEAHDDEAFWSHRTAFVAAAGAALAAAKVPITRLTLRVEADDATTYTFIHQGYLSAHPGMVTALASHPAARRVEELRVEAVDPSSPAWTRYPGEIEHSVGAYGLSLPPSSETLRVLHLRVLHLSKCSDLTVTASAPSPAAFPRLATLRLSMCSVHTEDLQDLLDASPELATVHLDSVFFKGRRVLPPVWLSSPPVYNIPPPPQDFITPPLWTDDFQTAPEVRLRCLSATALVLDLCGFEGRLSTNDGWAMVLDAPRLRSFRYKGVIRRFLLGSPALDMARVDLHLLDDNPRHRNDEYDRPAVFWRFVQNFTTVRDLKLKVPYLKDIATIGRARRAELLCAFPNVVHLELEGAHRPQSTTAAVAIANLLHCCPVVRDLRLNIRTVASQHPRYGGRRGAPSDHQLSRSRLDYCKSVDRFVRLRSNPATFNFNKDGSSDGGSGTYEEVPADIPGMNGRHFACLQTSLRRFRLQFQLDGSSCLGVRLLKFFAENAMVLEEMHVDTGNRRLHEHMNLGVEGWVAPDSSRACLQRKDLTESSWEFSKFLRISENSPSELVSSSAGFTVVPLQREAPSGPEMPPRAKFKESALLARGSDSGPRANFKESACSWE